MDKCLGAFTKSLRKVTIKLIYIYLPIN